MQVKGLVLLVQCVAFCAAFGYNRFDARDGELVDDSGQNSTNTTTTSSSSTTTTTSTTTSLTTITHAATISSDSSTDTTTTTDSSDSGTSKTSSDDSSSSQSTSQKQTTTTTGATSTTSKHNNTTTTTTTTTSTSTHNSTTSISSTTLSSSVNTTTTAAPTALSTSSSLFNTTTTTTSTSRCGIAGSFATPPSYATKANSIDECKAACSARGTSCQSFEAGTVDGDGNNCWLFAHSLSDMSIGSVQAGFTWTFYDKACDVTSKCGIQGSFITAPIAKLNVATLAACKAACAGNSDCQTFEAGSVDGSGNNCWLFDTSINGLNIGGATTGWKWAFFDKDCNVSS